MARWFQFLAWLLLNNFHPFDFTQARICYEQQEDGHSLSSQLQKLVQLRSDKSQVNGFPNDGLGTLLQNIVGAGAQTITDLLARSLVDLSELVADFKMTA